MTAPIPEQERYDFLVEASPMPTMIFLGESLIVASANQEMLNLLGKTRDIFGISLIEVLPELENQPFIGILKNVYKTGITYHSKESPADLIKDGVIQRLFFTFTYKAIKDSHGSIIGIISTAADLTDLVNARKQVAETENRLTFSLDSAKIGIWDLDPINNKVIWDARCRELFGFAKDGEIDYQQVLDLIHHEDESNVNDIVSEAIDPKNSGFYEAKFRIPNPNDEGIRWVHCKGKAYFNEDNIAYRLAGIAQDMTEEVTVRRREEQLLSLVNNNADHMTVADMDGKIIYMNNASRMLLGVDLGANVSKFSASDFYTPEELNRVQNHIIPNIDPLEGWKGNVTFCNYKTKELIPCMLNYMLIKDPITGGVIGRGCTARDLRPEIRAKADLQKLAAIVDSSEDFCNYCDIEGNTLYINPSGIKLIGIDKDNILQSNLFDYHSDLANEKIKNIILPILFSEGKWSGELELLHQITKEVIPIHKQFYMIREEITNIPVAIAGIARDLRSELDIRKILADKNDTLQSVVNELEFLANSVPSVVWTSAPDGKLDFINQRWYEQSGKPKGDTIGDTWIKYLHPDDILYAKSAWEKALATGEPYEVEFRSEDKDGVFRWYLVRAMPLKDTTGKIVKWYGTNTDVHHQKELEKQKDDFLGVASHELKTPVTSLKAYAQVLEAMFKRSGDLKNADLLGKMNKQINRLASLITDLLDVTKISSGRIQFNNTEFDFNDMVEEVVEEVQRTSLKHVIKKDLNFTKKIDGDRDRICQVVSNLLTNAVKYSPEAKEVIISTKEIKEGMLLTVQDFGIGILPELKEQVFEQFYRVSGNKEHTFPGLGLGLYISAEIVKRLGGKIWVDSVQNVGSIFSFIIPVK